MIGAKFLFEILVREGDCLGFRHGETDDGVGYGGSKGAAGGG